MAVVTPPCVLPAGEALSAAGAAVEPKAVACGLSGEPLGGPAERPRRGCIDIRIPYTLSRSHDGETLLGPAQVFSVKLGPLPLVDAETCKVEVVVTRPPGRG